MNCFVLTCIELDLSSLDLKKNDLNWNKLFVLQSARLNMCIHIYTHTLFSFWFHEWTLIFLSF